MVKGDAQDGEQPPSGSTDCAGNAREFAVSYILKIISLNFVEEKG